MINLKNFRCKILLCYLFFSFILPGFSSLNNKPIFSNETNGKNDLGNVYNRALKMVDPDPEPLGPSQPEVQSFRPADASNLVDPFSGDFSYNIPLMDVGGYPINIFYNSNVSMEDDASWVGLGWNLSPGAVNRNIRGLPDDFCGEKIVKDVNVLDNFTFGATAGAGINTEIFGFPIGLGANAGINYNSYNGLGVDVGLNGSTPFSFANTVSGGLGANLQFSSLGGFTLGGNANLGLKFENMNKDSYFGTFGSHNVSGGFSTNSRAGMSAQFNYGFTCGMLYKIRGENKQGESVGYNYPLTFSREVFTPRIDLPMNSLAVTGRLQAGVETSGGVINADLKTYYNWQGLAARHFENPAFGYLYSEEGNDDKQALFDFNREHEKVFEIENPQLPATIFSYDIYSVSGEGVSGMFRPFRSDIGTLANNEVNTLSGSLDVGGEVAIGCIAKVGGDVGLNIGVTYSGRWGGDNELKSLFKFQKSNAIGGETFYFKNVGEKNVMVNKDVFDALNGFEPFHQKLEEQGPLPAKLVTNGLSQGDIIKREREYRNTIFSIVNFSEREKQALEKSVYLFQPNVPFDVQKDDRDTVDFTNSMYRDKQIAEISITRDDGTRYFYGLPVYNTLKKEVSFNISGEVSPEVADNTNLVQYDSDASKPDNSIDNERGANHYYSATETPAYAYAYLLTAIVSHDYVDLTGDGPTSDDLGSYTKFNYSKCSDAFKWRTPVEAEMAYFEKGIKADPEDDMANYTYGTKQIFYLHSVETKNYVAEFKTSERDDMHGVTGENGGMSSSQSSMKLDSIILYSKSDRITHGVNATPIKTVCFQYSYELCKNHPASSGNNVGKLTLEKIVISYRDSKKEMRSPYVFRYSTTKPIYCYRCSDRWGAYKPNGSGFPFQNKFPFSPQSDRINNADVNASAWLLAEIDQPTGSTLKVFYESDDYGYVQNKRAMQMFPIQGLFDSQNLNNQANQNLIYKNNSKDNPGPNQFVFFNLSEPMAPGDTSSLVEYFSGIKELFFQLSAQTRYEDEEKHEDVKGFTDITGCVFGIDQSSLYLGKYTKAWIKLKNQPGFEPSFSFHPFALAAFDFMRRNYISRNRLLGKDSPIDDAIDVFVGFASAIGDAINGGFNQNQIENGIGKSIELDQSFIRLNNPDKKKIGGGSRVKRIEVHDNWYNMTHHTDTSYFYGTEYEYTTTEEYGETYRTISSGVASYEPMMGAEENPFSQPYRYQAKFPVFGIETFPTENNIDMKPYAECFYPSASIGYSEIKIRNLRRQGVKSTATGFIKKEFYTGKDFPTRYDEYSQSPFRFNPATLPLFALAQLSFDFLTMAQSHVIELNDMHGKPKAEKIYNEADSVNPVTYMEYKYKRQGNDNGDLNNNVRVVGKNGIISNELVGVEYDFIADEREYSSTFAGGAIQGNVDIIQTLVPTPVPMVWPALNTQSSIFRSFSTTKTIMRSGILEKVIAHDLGAVTTTRNELFDKETGMVVLTSSENEFGDSIYTLNIPAQWKYDGMGQAFQNQGYVLEDHTITGGKINDLNASENLFKVGDEVMNSNNSDRAWVISSTNNTVELIDETGTPLELSGSTDLKIMRSGRRNMQNLSVGKLVAMQSPAVGSSLTTPSKILNAEAHEFSDKWNTYAGFNIVTEKVICNCSGANFCEKAIAKLIAIGLDSLKRVNRFTISKNRTYRPLFDELRNCIDKSKMNDSTIIEFKIVDGNMIITLKYNENASCTIELTDLPWALFYSDATIIINSFTSTPNCKDNKVTFETDISFELIDNKESKGLLELIRKRIKTGLTSGEDKKIKGHFLVKGESDCFNRICWKETVPANYYCNISAGNIINPFRLGLLGSYRPVRSHAFLSERTTGRIDTSGIFAGLFTPFDYENPVNNIGWQFTLENYMVDPFGKILETRDPLERYDADLYGYGFNLVIASAKNARYKQIAFDNFEDYDYKNRVKNTGECTMPEHFSYRPVKTLYLVNNVSHTGFKCGKIYPGKSAVLNRHLTPNVATSGSSAPNILKGDQLVGVFNPDTGKYIISLWVFHDEINAADSSFEVTVNLYGNNPEVFHFRPFGKRIDGWQQVNGVFHVSNLNQDSIGVTLTNLSTRSYYVDDIRIQPFNSTMHTYVYDPVTLRLMAELDDNNFATFYEYDEEGNLERTKKETEEGIMTIQEVRSSKPKRAN